jgi:hypothetical protein
MRACCRSLLQIRRSGREEARARKRRKKAGDEHAGRIGGTWATAASTKLERMASSSAGTGVASGSTCACSQRVRMLWQQALRQCGTPRSRTRMIRYDAHTGQGIQGHAHTFDVSALHGVEFFLQRLEGCFQLSHTLLCVRVREHVPCAHVCAHLKAFATTSRVALQRSETRGLDTRTCTRTCTRAHDLFSFSLKLGGLLLDRCCCTAVLLLHQAISPLTKRKCIHACTCVRAHAYFCTATRSL